MEESPLAVQGAAIWIEHCLLHIYQDHEASGSYTKKLGGRVVLYLDDMLVLSKCRSTCTDGDESFVLPKVPNQHRQEHCVPFAAATFGFKLDSCSMMISLPA